MESGKVFLVMLHCDNCESYEENCTWDVPAGVFSDINKANEAAKSFEEALVYTDNYGTMWKRKDVDEDFSDEYRNHLAYYVSIVEMEIDSPQMYMLDPEPAFAVTENGAPVYKGKFFDEHMEAHKDVDLNVVKMAVGRLDLQTENYFFGTVSLPFTVGKCNCVSVSETDEVVFAKRIGRDGLTPVVFGRQPTETNCVTFGMTKKEGKWRIFTAFYGPRPEREPWDPNIESEEEQARCEEFWRTHALIYSPGMFQ